MEADYAVWFPLQTFDEVLTCYQNLDQLLHQNGQVAMYLIYVQLSLSIVSLIVICIVYYTSPINDLTCGVRLVGVRLT